MQASAHHLLRKTARFLPLRVLAMAGLVAWSISLSGNIPDAGAGRGADRLTVDAPGVTGAAKPVAHDTPNAEAAERLRQAERAAAASGRSPQALGAAVQGTHKILLLPVEFESTETFNYEMPDPADPQSCLTQQVTIEGPLHNEIPEPAHPDNATLWVPDFSTGHYNKLMFDIGPDGGIGVVRTDLNGGAGVDLSGLTFANYYLEQSEGALQVEGDVEDWIQLPASIGKYGADSCESGGGSDDEFGRRSRLVKDTVDALNIREPGFDWYQYDTDKDGYLDHLMVIHAGGGQEAAGDSIEELFTIWSHRSDVDPANGLGPEGRGGYQVAPPTTSNPLGVWVRGYTMMPENGDVGVFIHEYGHDLGLPDIYTQGADNSTGFWTLMSAGSWTGQIPGTQPAGLGIWERWVLGWADPVQVDLGDPSFEAVVGRASNTPGGTQEGIRVNLPDQVATVASPPQGENMWWGGQGNQMDNRLIRTGISLAGRSAPITLTFNTWTEIELDWDYAYVEVSTDGGSVWTSLDDSGDLTTNNDPNEQNFGNGITGVHDWTTATFDLSAYADQTVALRFRYWTDLSVAPRGWFVDDIKISDPGGVFFAHDVESGAQGWTSSPPGSWTIEDGTLNYPQYYLAEWRADSGFDHGLQHGYSSLPSTSGWQVQNVPSALPGMLVWFRNHLYDNNLDISANFDDPPSLGPKGFLMLVDSHPWPLRWPNGANLGGRVQPWDAAFSLEDAPAFTLTDPLTGLPQAFGPRPANDGFHDVLGYFPGFWYPGSGSTVYWNHSYASAVVPAPENYSIRITNKDGTPYLAGWGNWIGAFQQGSGDPGTHAYGVNIVITEQAEDGSWAKIRVFTDKDTFLGRVRPDLQYAGPGDIVTYTIDLKDAAGSVLETGQPLSYAASLVNPIPDGATYVPGSVAGAGAAYDANQDAITWSGVLGGTGIQGPDVSITFQVQLKMGSGMLVNTATVSIGAGNYQPDEGTYVLTAAIEVGVHGDVDCNGVVNSVDSLKILRHVAGLSVSQEPSCTTIGAGSPVAGDVDCNGIVNSVDSLKVLRYVASMPNNLPDGCGPIGG